MPTADLSTPTREERAILVDALGLLHSSRPHRNHCRALKAGLTRERCERLAAAGLLRRGHADLDGARFFFVTTAGAAAIGHNLPGERAP